MRFVVSCVFVLILAHKFGWISSSGEDCGTSHPGVVMCDWFDGSTSLSNSKAAFKIPAGSCTTNGGLWEVAQKYEFFVPPEICSRSLAIYAWLDNEAPERKMGVSWMLAIYVQAGGLEVASSGSWESWLVGEVVVAGCFLFWETIQKKMVKALKRGDTDGSFLS